MSSLSRLGSLPAVDLDFASQLSSRDIFDPEMTDNRRYDYTFRKLHGAKVKRPKTLRCIWCKEKIAVKPQGRLPAYCSHSCRQRAYERAKWQQPHLLALHKDLKRLAIRAEIRKEAMELLRQMGLVGATTASEKPRSARPALRVVPTTDPEE
jgi:hypothetical protein